MHNNEYKALLMGYENGFTITNKNSGTMGIAGNRIGISIVNWIWRGLVNTALRFTDGSRRFALLRCQIDNIKGPLKVHGLCLDMQSISSSVVQFFEALPSLKAPWTCRPWSPCLPSAASLHLRQLRCLCSTPCRRMGCASWKAEPRTFIEPSFI